MIDRVRFITHEVLPLVYDDSISYYEFLCKVLDKLNEVIDSDSAQNDALELLNQEIEDWESDTDQKYDEFVAQVDDQIEDFISQMVEEYNSQSSYYVGDYVYYENKIYRCIQQISTPETFDPLKWLNVVLADDLKNNQVIFEDYMTGLWSNFFDQYIQTLGVVQITGQSTTDVMSQKAVTDILTEHEENIENNEENIAINEKMLYNIYEVLKDTAYEEQTGTSPAYSQSIPENASKYADIQMIGGATKSYNQMVKNGNFVDTSDWSKTGCNLSTNNNVLTATITSASDTVRIQTKTPRFITGRKYFYTVTFNSAKAIQILLNAQKLTSGTAVIRTYITTANTQTILNGIYEPSNDLAYLNIYFNRNEALAVNDVVEISNVMVIDLTRIFGSGNEPTTVEEFKALYPNDYYTYSMGTLINGKCDKIVSLDSTDAQIQEYIIPNTIQAIPNYGCSNGDTVYNEVNIKNKKYIHRIFNVNLGILTWTYDDSNGFSLFTTTLDYLKIPSVAICGLYINNNVISISDLGNKEFSLYEDNGDYVVAIRDDSYTSASDFTTAMDGVMLYYELQTPQEYDISNYITDDNYIATSQGGSLVIHQIDTTLPLPISIMYTVKL